MCTEVRLLDLAEAPMYAHNVARGAYVNSDGVTQPAAAPRLLGLELRGVDVL